MLLKEHLKWLQKHVSSDSETPEDVVQLMACLVGMRLSTRGSLPAEFGKGGNLDMDIVQEGILSGLEALALYKEELGTLRQYLYYPILRGMHSYAWTCSSPISAQKQPKDIPSSFSLNTPYNDESGQEHMVPEELIDYVTPESLLQEAQEGYSPEAHEERLWKAFARIPKEDRGLLEKNAEIGWNPAKRKEWADSLGLSLNYLSQRLNRAKQLARKELC